MTGWRAVPDATLVQTQFTGGELGKFGQGRTDLPTYRTSLNVCLNGFPIEQGTWVRRPGFQWACDTRGGAPARVIKFDFQENAPYTMEFTDGHLRFLSGASLADTNDSAVITTISTANPAVVQLSSAVTWATGDQAFFGLLGTTAPLLQNRVFTLTKIDTTHFSLTDAVTGATIDGSTLNWVSTPAALLNRVLDIATPWSAGIWSSLRSVQTETTAFLLHGNVMPYALIVTAEPVGTNFATFSLGAAYFLDGPYLDPIPSSILSLSAATGIATMTLSLAAYSATVAYKTGDYVLSSSIGYVSLVDANVNNTPASSPTFWKVVGVGAPINNGQGIIASDIGRLVRWYSEPPLWVAGTTYAAKAIVSYNQTGVPGETTYWTALTSSNTGNIPGADLINWTITPANAALWSWGKIIGLSTTGLIDRALSGSVNIGSMTGTGSALAAAFDGITSQPMVSCAFLISTKGYVGKNYSGASAQTISQAIVYGSSDYGFSETSGPGLGATATVNLRAKATAPASSSDGTLLGTTGVITNSAGIVVTILSNDKVTTWNYVWVEVIGGGGTAVVGVAELQLYSASAAPGTACSVEILGPVLPYTAIRTWRIGAYSNTTGWPTCGTYSDDRLWLSGAIPNRIDACCTSGISGTSVNFAPTAQDGTVADSNAIDYTFTAPDVNPIFWMIPNLQGIACGTKAGEWLVIAPSTGGFSPTNISARRQTQIGCANIEPRQTEHTIIFVQKFFRKVMEYFADVFSGKFTAPDITKSWKHLTIGNVAEIAYQQELAPIVWTRVNGNLVGCTYKRDTLMTSQGPTFAGGHRHTLGSGRVIESIAVGPSTGGNLDALTMITNDTVSNVRHVEVLTDILDEGSTLAQAAYLDDAVTPSSTVSSNTPFTSAPYGGLTLNGLWHLNGKTVTAWLGGLDCGDYLVASGSIVVPYGDGVSAGTAQGLFTATFVQTYPGGTMPAVVGFTYTSQGQIVRPASPAESGARTGPALGKVSRAHKYAALLEGAQGVSFGTGFTKLLPALFRFDNGVGYKLNQQFSGIYFSDLQCDYTRQGAMLAWQVTRPYICNVVAVGQYLETTDE